MRRHAQLTGLARWTAGALASAFVMLAVAMAQPGPAATSGDGQWRMAAQSGGTRLALFDAEGRLMREWPVASLDGRQTSRVAAIRASTPRLSFVIALQDLPELWEISLDPQAAPIYDGLVHDYRLGEGLARPGYLGVRRSPLDAPLVDFRLDPSGQRVLGVTARGRAAGHALEVIHLAVRRRIARLPLAGPPDLDRLDFVDDCGRQLLVVPDRQGGEPQWFDTGTWAPRKAPADAAARCQPPG